MHILGYVNDLRFIAVNSYFYILLLNLILLKFKSALLLHHDFFRGYIRIHLSMQMCYKEITNKEASKQTTAPTFPWKRCSFNQYYRHYLDNFIIYKNIILTEAVSISITTLSMSVTRITTFKVVHRKLPCNITVMHTVY